MKTKQNLKVLLVPTYQRCCDCGKLKIAVAWQSLSVAPRSAQRWRFYCEACSRAKGVQPSLELTRKLSKMKTGRE